MDGLVTEIHRLRSLKALLQVRDSAQAAYSRAWVAQDKLHFQAKQFRDKGRNDKVRACARRCRLVCACAVSLSRAPTPNNREKFIVLPSGHASRAMP